MCDVFICTQICGIMSHTLHVYNIIVAEMMRACVMKNLIGHICYFFIYNILCISEVPTYLLH